jgi:hypothetical protein
VIYLKSFYPVSIPGLGVHQYGFQIHYNGINLDRVYQFYVKTETEQTAWISNIALHAGY